MEIIALCSSPTVKIIRHLMPGVVVTHVRSASAAFGELKSAGAEACVVAVPSDDEDGEEVSNVAALYVARACRQLGALSVIVGTIVGCGAVGAPTVEAGVAVVRGLVRARVGFVGKVCCDGPRSPPPSSTPHAELVLRPQAIGQ